MLNRFVLQAGESITAVMSGAKATTNPVAHVGYSAEHNQQMDPVALNGVTAVTLLSASAPVAKRYFLDGIILPNIDTAAVTVTVAKVNTAGTSYTLFTTTLLVNDTLMFDERGLRVVDVNGNMRVTPNSPYIPSNVNGQLGGGAAQFRLCGTLYEYADGTGLQAAATGADKVVAVYSIPANSFDGVQFRGIFATFSGNFAANGNTKQAKIIFNPATAVVGSTVGAGGTVIGDTGASAGNNVGWGLEGMVYKYGAANSNTQICQEVGTIVGSTHGGMGKATPATATENAAIPVAFTINDTSATTDATGFFANVFAMN